MGTSRRRFSREFELEAVRMVAGGRPSLAQVARELDPATRRAAPLESFFATLKKELLRGASFVTRLQARAAIFHSTEGFYNSRRLHSALGYRAAAEVESIVRVSPPPGRDNSGTGTLSSSSG